MVAQIKRQLREAGESVWQRYPLPGQPPSFRTAPQASQNVLSLFSGPILVARDVSLRWMKEAVLIAGRVLVVPDRSSQDLYQVPSSAMKGGVLRLDGAEGVPYHGTATAVVVGCLAFDPQSRRLYGFDGGQSENLLSSLDELLRGPRPLVVCLASDSQQVSGWPESAESHWADVVVTATRLISLGTGETEMF